MKKGVYPFFLLESNIWNKKGLIHEFLNDKKNK